MRPITLALFFASSLLALAGARAHAANSAPAISSGPSAISSGTLVLLEVTATDGDGPLPLTFAWTAPTSPGGSTVSFSSTNGTTTGDATVATIDTAGAYAFQVSVSDGVDATTGTVAVSITLPSANDPVIVVPAAANPNPAAAGGTATLTVFASDPNGDALTFTWSQVSGPWPTAFNPNGTNAASTTTATFGPVDGTYVLRVEVRDPSNNTATSDVTVTVGNRAPTITTTPDVDPASPRVGVSVTGSVTASDPDGDVLTFTWVVVSGPGTVSFSPNATTAASNTTFSFTEDGSYTLGVIASDGQDSTSATVAVTVSGPRIGGCMLGPVWWAAPLGMLALPVLVRRRRMRASSLK